jgi:hypothetical protein
MDEKKNLYKAENCNKESWEKYLRESSFKEWENSNEVVVDICKRIRKDISLLAREYGYHLYRMNYFYGPEPIPSEMRDHTFEECINEALNLALEYLGLKEKNYKRINNCNKGENGE